MRAILTVISENAGQLGKDASHAFDETGGVIGRNAASAWRLPDPSNTLSSRHATVSHDGHGFVITDTSMNGLYVNTVDEPVGRGNTAVLKNGDTLYMADYVISVEIVEDRQEQRNRLGIGAHATPARPQPPVPPPFAAAPAATPPAAAPARTPPPAPGPLPAFLQPRAPLAPPTNGVAPPGPAGGIPADILRPPTPAFAPIPAFAPVPPREAMPPASTAMTAPPPPRQGGFIPDDAFADLMGGLAPARGAAGNQITPDFVPAPAVSPALAAMPAAPALPAAPRNVIPVDLSLDDLLGPVSGPARPPTIAPPAIPAAATPLAPLPSENPALPVSPVAEPAPRPRLSDALSADMVDLRRAGAGPAGGGAALDPVAILRRRAGGKGAAGFAALPPLDGTELERRPTVPDATVVPADRFAGMAMPGERAAPPPGEAVRSTRPAGPPVFAAPAGPVPPAHDTAGDAFLEGLGIDAARLPAEGREAVLREAGRALRLAIEGLVAILSARRSLKGEFQIEQTTLRSNENNPLKFLQSVGDILQQTLVRRPPGFLGLPEAIEDGIRDLQAHEMATIVAMQAALMTLLRRLEPGAAGPGGGFFGRGPDKARQWDQFVELHARLSRELADFNQSQIGAEFARVYADQIEALRRGTRA